jgi:hypothetical protein
MNTTATIPAVANHVPFWRRRRANIRACVTAIMIVTLYAAGASEARAEGWWQISPSGPYEWTRGTGASPNGPTAMAPQSNYYCWLTGFSGLGADQSRSSPVDGVWVDWTSSGDWLLDGQGGRESGISANAYCIQYGDNINNNGLQQPYQNNPWPTYYPSGAQWSSTGTVQNIWNNQAFCSLGGLQYDGLPQSRQFIAYTIQYPDNGATSPVAPITQFIQFNSQPADEIESQCIWFPGPSTTNGFAAIQANSAQRPLAGQVIEYTTSNMNLGSAFNEICALLQVYPKEQGAVSVNLAIGSNNDWTVTTSGEVGAKVGCIAIDQAWPGWPNGN